MISLFNHIGIETGNRKESESISRIGIEIDKIQTIPNPNQEMLEFAFSQETARSAPFLPPVEGREENPVFRFVSVPQVSTFFKERAISFCSEFSVPWDDSVRRPASSTLAHDPFCQQPREYGSGTIYLPTHLWHMASAVTPLGLLHMRPLQHWLHSRVPGPLNRAPTRAVGSASSLTADPATAVGQARASPHGQHCGCLIHQPVGRYTITPHVTARPPSPPLESHTVQVTARCSHPGEAQSCG